MAVSFALVGSTLILCLLFGVGLPGNGLVHHARTWPEPVPSEETQRLRPVPLTELD
jgi:hypothetical protein